MGNSLRKDIIVILILILGISACRKDFEKISTSRWNPEITLPFIQTEIQLRDIIPDDSSINTRPDSLLYFAYHQDSVFSFAADSLIDMFDNDFDTSYNFSLGELSIDTFDIQATYSMSDALPYLDQAVRDTLLAYDKTENIFPPFSFSTPITIELQPIDLYRNLTFSNGFLIITVNNGLPVKVNDIRFSLKDMGNNITLKTINIESLDAGENFSDTLFLRGLSLSNRFSFQVTNFNSEGSFPDSVFIDLEKGLDFSFSAKNLRVIGGTAILPQQIMYSEILAVNFSTVNNEKLYNVIFSGGNFQYDFNSELPVRIYAELKLPSALVNGVIPTADIVIPAFDTYNGSWTLENMRLDLSSDTTHPFNKFPIEINIVVMPSGEMIEFDSANKVHTLFSSKNVKPSYAEGFFGKQEIDIDTDTIAVEMDFLQQLQGEIILDNPVFKLSYYNGFGIPIILKTDFKAVNSSTNDIVSLDMDSIRFVYPETPGNVEYSTVQIDKTNSQIVDFMAIRPDIISFSGGGFINYNNDTLNFVYDTSSLNAALDVIIPLKFVASNLNLSDTLPLDASNSDIPLNKAALKVLVTNGFPFETHLFLQLGDSLNGEILNTLDLGTVLPAVINENTGRVVSPHIDSLTVNIDKTFIDDLKIADRGIFLAKLSTAHNNNVAVGLYSDYKIKVAVGFTAAVVKP
jgi:hypothetical protein